MSASQYEFGDPSAWDARPADQAEALQTLPQELGHQRVGERAQMRRDELVDREVAAGSIEHLHRIDDPVALAAEEAQQRRVILPAAATPVGHLLASGEDQDDRLRAVPKRGLVEQAEQASGYRKGLVGTVTPVAILG